MNLEVSFVRQSNVTLLSLLSPSSAADSQGIAVNFQILLQCMEGQGASTKEQFLQFQLPPVLPQPIMQL